MEKKKTSAGISRKEGSRTNVHTFYFREKAGVTRWKQLREAN